MMPTMENTTMENTTMGNKMMESKTMENKTIVRRYYEQVWNRGNLAFLGEVVARDHEDHDPAPLLRVAWGRENIAQTVAAYRAAFPDLWFTIEEMIAEADMVVTRWSAQGTQKGSLGEIPPTGQQAQVSGIFIDRLIDGQIVESWISWDQLGLLKQLGVIGAAPVGA